MSGILVGLDDILNGFANANVSLPVEEIGAALAQWDEVAPVLLERLERAAPEDEALLWVSIYLMGEMRETRAYRPLCALARDGERLAEIIGDGVTQDLHTILARVFDGDGVVLCGVVDDGRADDAPRGAALSALALLAREGRVERDWAEAYLRAIGGRLRRDDVLLSYAWHQAVCDLQMEALRPMLDAAFRRGCFDEVGVGIGELHADFATPAALDTGEFDAVARLSAFTLGEDDEEELVTEPIKNPLRGVGRNDPCICGSGKKFKKCCLGK